MRRHSFIVVGGVILLLFGGGPAGAHHSQAMYDAGRRIALTGTVRAFQWANPHVRITLTVRDEQGALVEWDLEGGAPDQLRRRGWRRDSLAAGETVTAIVHPLRSGAPGGVITRVLRAEGALVGDPPPQIVR